MNIKLGDFGIAVLIKDTTKSKDRAGTLIYQSPELLNGGTFSAKSDIW